MSLYLSPYLSYPSLPPPLPNSPILLASLSSPSLPLSLSFLSSFLLHSPPFPIRPPFVGLFYPLPSILTLSPLHVLFPPPHISVLSLPFFLSPLSRSRCPLLSFYPCPLLFSLPLYCFLPFCFLLYSVQPGSFYDFLKFGSFYDFN